MTSPPTTTEGSSSPPPPPPLDLGQLGVGLMQWGTTDIDHKIVNPKGNLSDEECCEIWKTCRQSNIIFFDTAEGRLLSLHFVIFGCHYADY